MDRSICAKDDLAPTPIDLSVNPVKQCLNRSLICCMHTHFHLYLVSFLEIAPSELKEKESRSQAHRYYFPLNSIKKEHSFNPVKMRERKMKTAASIF